MLLDPVYAVSHAGQVVGVVLWTFLGKSVLLGVLARAFGYVNMAPWIDPGNTSVTLQTLSRAAHAIGRDLRIELV
jgi:hypothetical protein